MKRLQKYISECGICSRRKAEELICAGKVSVNGNIVTEMGYKIDDNDSVVINGKTLTPQKKVYIMLNKPKGYITAVSDDRGRKTVIDLVSDIKENLFPVGRLDYDTEGLLILTSDGDFANKLIHPSKNILKTYLAKLDNLPSEADIEQLKKGVAIEDYTAVAKELTIYNKKNKICLIKISTGKNRQVKKMFEYIGLKVVNLKRISIGQLELGDLKVGSYRYLDEDELEFINIL